MSSEVKSTVEHGHSDTSDPRCLQDWRSFVSEDWKGIAHLKREQRETGCKMLYTIEELAEAAGVSVKTLRRRTTAGAMPRRWWDIPRRQYFYYVPDLARWLESSAGPKPPSAAVVAAKACQS